MKLSDPIETVGFFWLPTNPEDRLPGILRISSVGKVTLEVIGTFGGWQNAFQEMGIRPEPTPSGAVLNCDRILGLVEDGGLVTLEECLPAGSKVNFPSRFSKSSFLAKYAFIGGNYDSGTELRFSEVKFSIEGLDDWLFMSWFREEQNRKTKSGTIEYQLPEDIVFELPNEVRLTLKHVLSHPNVGVQHSSARIDRFSILSLKLERPCLIIDFLPLITKLCNFLSLAVDQFVSIEFISCYLEEDCETVDELRSPLRLYYESSTNDSEKPEIKQHEILFSFGNVAERCEKHLSDWLTVYESFEPAFNLYFASKSNSSLYIDVRFLHLTQVVETLHRRSCQDTVMPEDEFRELCNSILGVCPQERKEWMEGRLKYANELSLRQRMKDMVYPFQTWFGGKKQTTTLVNKVVNARNYLTHYDSRFPTSVASGENLWWLSQKLEALFQLHLLTLIGVDPKPIVEGHNKLADKLKLRL